jgi:hypothetical protein
MPDDSALITSSGKPSAFPTSRIAPLGPIARNRRAKGCLVLTLGFVDPLYDLLAPFVFEVDVNVRRLGALLGDEPFEEEGRWSLDRRM